MEIGVHEAKTHLSKLLRRVAAGEEIIIARGGKPIAKLVPVTSSRNRQLGRDVGLVQMSDDFNAPLPEDFLSGLEK